MHSTVSGASRSAAAGVDTRFVRVKAPADLRNCTGKTQGHLFRVGETFLMQLHRSRPEPRLSTFERCWLGGAMGLAQRTGDTRDLFALRSPGSVSPLCPTCAPVKANGAARKARERDKRVATETRLRGWACEIRTQKCHRKLSLCKIGQICGNPAEFRPGSPL